MDNLTAEMIIEKYKLEPHIEGGHFREDFKSEIMLPDSVTKKGERSLITTCYYLIKNGERCIFHRLSSDEIWNFFCGGPVNFYEIDPNGNLSTIVFGPHAQDHHLKHFVKRGNWFGVLPHENTDFAFFTAIVVPGFDYADWEKGDREHLTRLCPQAKEIIHLLT